MKPGILVLLLLMVTGNIFGQNNYSEPLQLNRNFLVHSAGLPQEYLLYIPDSATQILFNPARANNFSTNFIYVDYLSDYILQSSIPLYPIDMNIIPEINLQKSNSFNFPDIYRETFTSSKNPTFSAVALLNIGGSKWLFELTNGINRFTNSNISRSIENDTYAVMSYELINNSETNNSANDGMTTSFKISRIFQSGKLNFSTGLFGIINRNNIHSFSEDENNDYRFQNLSDSTKYRDHDNQYLRNNNDADNSRYVVGGEFTLNNKYWDYLFTIDYQ